MNILVIGLGSMGRRRIRLLKKNLNIHSVIGVDVEAERRSLAEAEYGIKTYSNLKEAICANQFDCAFVCSAPLSHFGIIDKCLDYKINIFSEINLVSKGYERLISKAKKNDCKLFLSSTPMYRREIQYIIQRVKNSKEKLNYIYHMGQYLPDWHPWESYKEFFVGDKQTNGCREIFAIELPWILDAFGEVESVYSVKSKNTSLEIDYNDNYIAIIKHKNGHKGVVCFDVISRKATKNFEVYGETLHIQWGGTSETLLDFNLESAVSEKIITYASIDKNPDYSEHIIENMYVDEIVDFMNYMQNDAIPRYSFEKDINTLKIIDEIESGSI